MTTKTIKVNYSDLKNIKKAETLKERLENKGFNLIDTRQIGFDIFLLSYSNYEEVEQWLLILNIKRI